MNDPRLTYAWLLAAALLAGAINAVAGGGTLLTFPALLAVPVCAVDANATSTLALVPGSLAGTWGYRRELRRCRRWALLLAGPSLLGGLTGALLLTKLPELYFRALVPWLLLGAALLFLSQPAVARLRGSITPGVAPPARTLAAVMVLQFAVAVYGGYFGAGIGILMLAFLGLAGIGDIHQLNALKTLLAACINGVSVVVFVAERKIVWHYALVMALGAIAGGYLGARITRRLHQDIVRWAVVVIGLGLAAYFFYGQ